MCIYIYIYIKGKRLGGSLGKVGSFSPLLSSHVIGHVGHRRGRWGKQVLEPEPRRERICCRGAKGYTSTFERGGYALK